MQRESERSNSCVVVVQYFPLWVVALQRRSDLCTSRKGTARSQFQFPHSCICERFVYSDDRSTYFPASRIGRLIMGIYKSLTDTWMWKLGLRPRSFISGNICFEFSVFCLCSAGWCSTVYCTEYPCNPSITHQQIHCHPCHPPADSSHFDNFGDFLRRLWSA
jgi:hypothetical protein